MANITKEPDTTIGLLFPNELLFNVAERAKIVRNHKVHISTANDKTDYILIEVDGVVVGTFLVNPGF